MSVKKILLAQYDLHHLLFNNVIDGVSEEEANTSLCGLKTIKWLAGHMLWDQGSFANICNMKDDFMWHGHFHSMEGADSRDLSLPQTEEPTLAMIIIKWNETVPRIRKGLEKLTKKDMDRVVNIPHPLFPFDNTLAGLWAFANHHQAYNIGQISALRKGFGRKGMSYSVKLKD